MPEKERINFLAENSFILYLEGLKQAELGRIHDLAERKVAEGEELIARMDKEFPTLESHFTSKYDYLTPFLNWLKTE